MATRKRTHSFRIARANLARANRKHPFLVALQEHKTTVRKAARRLGYPRSTVQSWYASNKVIRRPCPPEAKAKAKELYGVPLSAWE